MQPRLPQGQRLPKYSETFIPILGVLKDGSSLHTKDIRMKVRECYYTHLPNELLHQKTPTTTGSSILFDRITWGLSYLKIAGYVEQVKRAYYKISPKGLKANKLGTLTLNELKKQPEYIAHHKARAREESVQPISPNFSDDVTPQEKVDQGMEAIANEVKDELFQRMTEMDPYQFEILVNDLLEAMGYGSVEGTNKSNDGGIDGVVNQDKLGLEKIYVQAKRYKPDNKVHETSMRDFIGAMSGDTHKGIFVTTSEFDQKAQQKAKDAHHKIVLINGLQLCNLMYQYGVGVQKKKTIIIKSIDEDYFGSE
jgi:restriction system protein